MSAGTAPTAGTTPFKLPPPIGEPGFAGRRVQNWMLLGMLYAFFYMTRYNLSANIPFLSEYLGWTNTDYGVFSTVMPIVYGISVFLNGPLADRMGGKKAFLIGTVGVIFASALFGAGALLVTQPAVWAGEGAARTLVSPATLAFGLTKGSYIAILATIWGINGYFQSFGALSIVKVNAHWFHISERGTFAGVFGVLIRFGLILAFNLSPLILLILPWQYAFWLPAAVLVVLFFLNYFFMEDSPKKAGYADLDTGDGGEADDGSPVSLKYVLERVFSNKAAWIIALASMMIGIVRRTVVDDWWPKYMGELLGVARDQIGSYAPYQVASAGIAVAGIFGGFAFGIASDRLFQSRRAPVITFGFIGMAVMLAVFGLVHQAALGPWAAAACLGVLSFFVNGAHGMVGGAASMDFGGKKAAATAAGLFDGAQYLAAGLLAGVGVGALIDKWTWSAWMWMPIPFAIIGALVMMTLWNVTPAKRKGH